MSRIWFFAAAFAALATAALAQSDLVAARKSLMSETGKFMYRALPAMIKGEQPYDQATVDAAFAQMTEVTKRLPALYPESTKDTPPTGRFSVSPKMWANKADFEARIAKYAADVAAARPKAVSLDGLKAVLPTVMQNCDGCHDNYRVRN